MKPHHILFAILGIITLSALAQEATTIVRSRTVENIPAGLNTSLRNAMATYRAQRPRAERTVITITVIATGSDTNVQANINEWVPFVEQQ